MSFELKACSAV